MTKTYETVEGTEPTTHGAHEPRVIKQHITPDPKFDEDYGMNMMTEIGDGVFVQWSTCRKCTKRVYDCKCVGGPVEPPYMKKWRDDRFKRDLDTRPDPSYQILPSVISWLRERGYTVTAKSKKQDPSVEEVLADNDGKEWGEVEEALVDAGHDPAEYDADGMEYANPDPEDEDKVAIDSGLQGALDRVRSMQKDLSGIEDEF